MSFLPGFGMPSGVTIGIDQLLRGIRPPAPNPGDVPPNTLPAVQPMAQDRGLFGLKGTPRDVLGSLGDAFLVQSGNDPVYQPSRDRRRRMGAMQGFMDDPVAAIQRMAEIDPDAAYRMYQEHQEAELARKKAERENTSAGLLDRTRQDDVDAITFDRIDDMYRARVPIEVIQQYAKSRGTTIPFEFPEEYDENFSPRAFAISAKDEETLARQDRIADNTITNTVSDNERADALAINTIRNTGEDNTRADRVVDNTVSNTTADNDRADRNTDSLISSRRGNRFGNQPSARPRASSNDPAPTGEAPNGTRRRNPNTGTVWIRSQGAWKRER